MRFAPTGPGFLIYYTLQEYSVLIANLYSEYDDAAVVKRKERYCPKR